MYDGRHPRKVVAHIESIFDGWHAEVHPVILRQGTGTLNFSSAHGVCNVTINDCDFVVASFIPAGSTEDRKIKSLDELREVANAKY